MWSALADFKPTVMDSEVNPPKDWMESVFANSSVLAKLEQNIQWISHVSVQVQEKDDS